MLKGHIWHQLHCLGIIGDSVNMKQLSLCSILFPKGPFCCKQCTLYNRGILILTFFRNPYFPKLGSLVHWFQNHFCFLFSTFPSHVVTFGQQILVLYRIYNEDAAPKFVLVITFDWGSYRPKVDAPELHLGFFRDTSLDHIYRTQICAPNLVCGARI